MGLDATLEESIVFHLETILSKHSTLILMWLVAAVLNLMYKFKAWHTK